MRYIIHGEGVVDSRKYLTSLKKRYEHNVFLDGTNLSLQAFNERALNPSLFPGETLLVIENFDGPEKIFSAKEALDSVFWWAKTLDKVPNADKVLHFKETSAFGIFRFADSIGQKKTREALILLDKLLEEKVPPENIVGVLVRQFKLIAQVLDGKLAEVSKSEFVRKKLSNQARNWNLKGIFGALALLFQTDLRIKKGQIKPQVALVFLTSELCKD